MTVAGPLAGVNVVEIAGIGPAPCAGMMLADMGASVTLIERKTHNSNAAMTTDDDDVSHLMLINRGKKSIAVDLKRSEGVELILRLIADADVLIEGFRPGVMERLGLGPDVCLRKNPKLVYGRMTGWGQPGPLAQAAGHDTNYIGLSGALWYGGRATQAPSVPLTLVGDVGGGTMMLLWGVMCAIIHAQKTGMGQVVDAAITDGSAYLSSLLWMMRSTGLLEDELGKGWVDGATPWNDTYACSDGKFVTICSLEPKFYQELLQRLELMDDPLFSNQWDSDSWPAAKATLSKIFKSKTRAQWCELLEGTDVCFAPVLNFSEASEHPHNQQRQTFLTINGVRQPAPAPKLNVSKAQAGVPPKVGQHTDELLQTLGLDEQTIITLKEKQVI